MVNFKQKFCQIEEAVSKTSGDVLLPFQEAYPPRLKYLLMMSWPSENNNGIFSTLIYLSGQLDERIARALDVDACLIPDKKYDPYQSCYWHVKIAPTDALNRLANEFHYKVVSSWSSGKYARIYWTLEHVGI